MDAAEAWADAKCGRASARHPIKVDRELQDEFADLGVQVELDEVEEDGSMPILRENWNSVLAFLDCETQWRVTATMAGLIWLGLDYTAVKILLDAEGHGTDIFRDIRIMEVAALPVLNEAD